MFFSKMQLSDEKVEITSITLFSYLLKGEPTSVKFIISSGIAMTSSTSHSCVAVRCYSADH